MHSDIETRLRELAAKRGVDLDGLAASSEVVPFDPKGWRLDDPVAFRTDLVRKILKYEVDGEFHPERLPKLDHRTKQWIDQQKEDPDEAPFLLIAGNTGSGKTSQGFHCIIELAMHAASQNRTYRWRYVSHSEFSAEARPGGAADPEEVIDKYKQCDLLLLDDLGAYNPTTYAIDCVNRIINHRYHHRLATVTTTNLLFVRSERMREEEQKSGQRIAVLADMLDDRALSRLRSGWLMNLGNVDHRANRGKVLR